MEKRENLEDISPVLRVVISPSKQLFTDYMVRKELKPILRSIICDIGCTVMQVKQKFWVMPYLKEDNILSLACI